MDITTNIYDAPLGNPKKKVCPGCGKTYTYYSSYVPYIYDRKRFCTYSCKAKYKREHPPKEDEK